MVQSHFIEYCTECLKVISQCRCIDCNKTTRYGICSDCQKKTKVETKHRHIIVWLLECGEYYEAADIKKIFSCKELAMEFIPASKGYKQAIIPGYHYFAKKEKGKKRWLTITPYEIDEPNLVEKIITKKEAVKIYKGLPTTELRPNRPPAFIQDDAIGGD